MIIGTLANYDNKSNGNFKKAIGEQTNNSAHALCFFANCFAIPACEMAKSFVRLRMGTGRQQILPSLSELGGISLSSSVAT